MADRINEMADTLNVGHLMVLLHYGSMPKDVTMHNTRMFAEKVIPRLRHRFGDWEDRWFPREETMIGQGRTEGKPGADAARRHAARATP